MSKETKKPHIARLPIPDFTPHPVTNNELAVSIPLFYSATDSGTMRGYDSERIKHIHTKAAIWAAIALQNNTDLAEHGIGIYFHVEDIIHDTVAEMFTKSNVPQELIRTMTLPKPRTELKHPQYGKVLMCLDDPEITPKAWLIADSDAFVCSTGKRLKWYDRLVALENPATLQVTRTSATPYEMWVYGVCLAAGLRFDPETDLFMQEQRAYRELGFDYLSHGSSEDLDGVAQERPFIASQLTYLPTTHDIYKFLWRHYPHCYQDEFLIGIWHQRRNDITPLTETLDGLPLFYSAADYMRRDKAEDVNGYLLHINADTDDNTAEQVDVYFEELFDGLTCRGTETTTYKNAGVCRGTETTTDNREAISQKLQQTASDKESENGHRYGTLYDLIFDAVAHRQNNRNLRICEIGVSFFGEGSLKAFQELPNVAEVVGIDLLPYEGHLAPHTTFHKVDDAYTHQTIHMLKQHHDPFDIIIDDGSHDPKDQEFFIKYYPQLLTDGGILICEDVYDADFFKRMCDEAGCYGFDGWANLGPAFQQASPHNERILMRDSSPHHCRSVSPCPDRSLHHCPSGSPCPDNVGIKQSCRGTETTTYKNGGVCRGTETTPYNVVNGGRGTETTPDNEVNGPPHKFRFHLLGIAYGPTHKTFSACAFAQKTRKGSNMLHKLGHEVYHYGHENTDIDCTEHIPVIDDFVLQKTYGSVDHNGAPQNYSVDDLAFTTFDINTERELRKRAQPGDFVLASFAHKNIHDRIADLPVHVVEWGIGYPITYAGYRVYESNGWMHFHRGVDHTTGIKDYTIPDWCSVVIPNYFDPTEFEYSEQKEDYMLFIGRVDRCKGIEIVLEMAKRTGIPLRIAGPNLLGDELFQMLPRNADYIGVINSEERKVQLSKAIALVCPSMYLEPFLGVHIEAGFCGTPVITTNWGAPVEYCKHGITGFRCQTGEQFLWALQHVHQIRPESCRIWATSNFSMDRIGITYHEYFQVLYRNINGFFWEDDAQRQHLNWLRMNMSPSEIRENIAEIQAAV